MLTVSKARRLISARRHIAGVSLIVFMMSGVGTVLALPAVNDLSVEIGPAQTVPAGDSFVMSSVASYNSGNGASRAAWQVTFPAALGAASVTYPGCSNPPATTQTAGSVSFEAIKGCDGKPFKAGQSFPADLTFGSAPVGSHQFTIALTNPATDDIPSNNTASATATVGAATTTTSTTTSTTTTTSTSTTSTTTPTTTEPPTTSTSTTSTTTPPTSTTSTSTTSTTEPRSTTTSTTPTTVPPTSSTSTTSTTTSTTEPPSTTTSTTSTTVPPTSSTSTTSTTTPPTTTSTTTTSTTVRPASSTSTTEQPTTTTTTSTATGVGGGGSSLGAPYLRNTPTEVVVRFTTFVDGPHRFEPLDMVDSPNPGPLELTQFDNESGMGGTVESGSLIYTPPTGFVGEDSYTFTASDGLAETTFTVLMTVLPDELALPEAAPNEPPGLVEVPGTLPLTGAPFTELLVISGIVALLSGGFLVFAERRTALAPSESRKRGTHRRSR